jgi:chromosome segregation ATPase
MHQRCHPAAQNVSLEKGGEWASEGVQLRYRPADGSRGWACSLEQLSGGQRTLISLALLLAVSASSVAAAAEVAHYC